MHAIFISLSHQHFAYVCVHRSIDSRNEHRHWGEVREGHFSTEVSRLSMRSEVSIDSDWSESGAWSRLLRFSNAVPDDSLRGVGAFICLSVDVHIVFSRVFVCLCVCSGRNSVVQPSVLGEFIDAAVNESLDEFQVCGVGKRTAAHAQI